jgi:hypothetical protein
MASFHESRALVQALAYCAGIVQPLVYTRQHYDIRSSDVFFTSGSCLSRM